ncbi:hypothetical protein GCM10011391_31490 [Pullulanibacillus camelliae]|uniref:Transposase DDE domain-containing protein n=1 Tax=Pullulanibacillus camelliae TaxID=1707096 RepID=A0A8J3DYV3_9BACL|nr:transposase [Pullulanibacillus camelliae]GGE50437.1 hypothetical protein GCM10011391_31490 [Pullulanibacillus camelliae]
MKKESVSDKVKSPHTQPIGTEALASQPSLSRFFRRFDDQSIEGLNQANQEFLDKVHQHRAPEALIFDLDSTHADTEEATSLPAASRTRGGL